MSLDVPCAYIFIYMGLQGDKNLPIFPKGFLIKAESSASQSECCLYESILEKIKESMQLQGIRMS